MRGRLAALRSIQLLALAGSVASAAVLSESSDWQAPVVIAGLLAFGLATELVPLRYRDLTISGSFMSIVLAGAVAGPLPAVLIALCTTALNAGKRRAGFAVALPNLSTHAVFALVGALAFEGIRAAGLLVGDDISFIPIVAAVGLAMNLLNFLLIALDVAVVDGGPKVRDAFGSVFLEFLPVELAASLLTAATAYAYIAYGTGALMFLAVVGLEFHYLIRMALTAAQRRDAVEERNKQLAALQFGLISTTMKTLALRDHMTARHSAAVARYAREVAAALGLSEQEQDLFHIAGLFHDIGKFIFPDSILLANSRLTDEEYAIVRRHPEVGADLIAEIEGYGPVAEIVRHHHEQIDGSGYPFGIHGDAIPLGSRVLAVADVYDVLTARDTYREPVSTSDAFAELRRVAGTQLDARIVEVFVELVSRRGLMFSHSDPHDFEAELALEHRVEDYAAPRVAA